MTSTATTTTTTNPICSLIPDQLQNLLTIDDREGGMMNLNNNNNINDKNKVKLNDATINFISSSRFILRRSSAWSRLRQVIILSTNYPEIILTKPTDDSLYRLAIEIVVGYELRIRLIELGLVSAIEYVATNEPKSLHWLSVLERYHVHMEKIPPILIETISSRFLRTLFQPLVPVRRCLFYIARRGHDDVGHLLNVPSIVTYSLRCIHDILFFSAIAHATRNEEMLQTLSRMNIAKDVDYAGLWHEYERHAYMEEYCQSRSEALLMHLGMCSDPNHEICYIGFANSLALLDWSSPGLFAHTTPCSRSMHNNNNDDDDAPTTRTTTMNAYTKMAIRSRQRLAATLRNADSHKQEVNTEGQEQQLQETIIDVVDYNGPTQSSSPPAVLFAECLLMLLLIHKRNTDICTIAKKCLLKVPNEIFEKIIWSPILCQYFDMKQAMQILLICNRYGISSSILSDLCVEYILPYACQFDYKHIHN